MHAPRKVKFLREEHERASIFSSFRLSGPDPEASSVIGRPQFLGEHIYSLSLSQRNVALMKSDSNIGPYDYRLTIFRTVFQRSAPFCFINLSADKINISASEQEPHVIFQRSYLKASVETPGLSDRGNNKVTQAIKTINDVGN